MSAFLAGTADECPLCLAAMLGMVLVVELILFLGGAPPSNAARWAAATIASSLAIGMTYGLPVFLCWWALRTVRRTTSGWSWAWVATSVIVVTSFIFRLHVFRLDNGQFALDSSGALRVAVSYLVYGEALPAPMLFECLIRMGVLSVGFLLQAAFLIGATALVIRRHRRTLAAMATEI